MPSFVEVPVPVIVAPVTALRLFAAVANVLGEADVAELAYAQVLGACGEILEGSSPSVRTLAWRQCPVFSCELFQNRPAVTRGGSTPLARTNLRTELCKE